ncbi:molybdopterin molybdotransferase MoeA [soil metagenome]
MLSVAEARERVLARFEALPPVEVPVSGAAGLVVAEDLTAPHSLPRFDTSAMDGYALRAEDAASASPAPVSLRIVGEVRAGDPGALVVEPGTAARIMTGAPLPPGADAIVPVEETEEVGGQVLLQTTVPAGRHVRPAGDDIRTGQTVIPAGLELGAGELAVAASLGLSPLKVRRGPRVAVLVTGDELVDPEADPAPGQIRDSNSLAIRTLVAEAGGEVVSALRVPDDLDETRRLFAGAAQEAELVVSSGGVAVGRYDFVKDVVEDLGGIELWRVAMQPGKPVVLGQLRATPFLGLPGNPVSIHVGFEQFVRPAIRKMRGCKSLLRPVVKAELTEPLHKPPGRLHFVRVRLAGAVEEWRATPTGAQGSHIQSSLVDCHGVARFPVEATDLSAGDLVDVEVWRLPEGA